MKGYKIDVCCAECGCEVYPVTAGVVLAGTHTSAISRCGTCRAEWQSTFVMRRSPTMAAVRQGKHRERIG